MYFKYECIRSLILNTGKKVRVCSVFAKNIFKIGIAIILPMPTALRWLVTYSNQG